MDPIYIFVFGLFVLMGLGLPVFVALGLTCMLVLIATSTSGSIPVELLSLKLMSTLSGFPLLAIPLFILAANILNTGSATRRIFDFANVLVGYMRGGLGHANVVASMVFAGMSGTAAADAAGLGALEIKAMKERGYCLKYSTGITAASSVIGPIIPPSVAMLVYGWLADVSVSQLFIGGVLPGLLMALLLMGMTVAWSYRTEMPRRAFPSWQEFCNSFKEAFFPLLTPAIIAGGIWTGIFSPTEAGAVACVYGLFLGFCVCRDLSFRDLYEVLRKSAEFSAVILLIIAVSGFYGWLLLRLQIPQQLAGYLVGLELPGMALILLMMLFFLLVGCFMSVIESVLILTPILAPALLTLGVDPLFFGVFMIVTLSAGVITPPFGTVLFVMVPITGMSFQQVVKAVLPFFIPILVTILLMAIFPGIVTALPGLIFG
ncbi:MAG: TRAP transporter large permease [Oceanospirillaceae bacterium]|nr:TRAP transporter large permease [Oceanospirillaceae bacterium]